jgi:Holliday junction resolvase RusA-like endonuclease
MTDLAAAERGWAAEWTSWASAPVAPVRLEIKGRPRPGERAGTTPDGRRYSQAKTKAVQADVSQAWTFSGGRAGRPKRITGPVAVRILAVYPRPAGHLLKGGGLSAAGLRSHLPTSTLADLDNLAKPILDGLKGLAWTDDHQVCSLQVDKVWDDGRGARTVVWVSAMFVTEVAA